MPCKSIAERFWSKVDKSGVCWMWTGAIDSNGYGNFSVKGKTRKAPQVALELSGAPRPCGAWALHHCDNPPCVNPGHLFWGDHRENLEDAARKGRLPVQKLMPDGVREVRRLLGEGLSCVEVGRQVGMTRGAISKIKTGRTWRHVR